MDTAMMKLKPYKGRYCSRKRANIANDFFSSLPAADEEKLKAEAEEFRQFILAKRKNITKAKV